MDDVYTKYKDNSEIAMFVVYVREPHAGEENYENIEQPETMDERKVLARKTCDEDHLVMPFLIDEMDNGVRATYGDLPNSAVIIGKDGIILEKHGWADPEKIDETLTQLLGEVSTDAP